jgi:hypothetical protein
MQKMACAFTLLCIFRTAGHFLGKGSRLFLYGPFKRDGQHTSEGNASFDESLRVGE